MTDQATVIVLTPDQLNQLVRQTWEQARHEMKLPEVMSRDEVAMLLQVHPKTVNNYVAERGLPAHKLGQEYRFRRSEVLEWLSKQPAKGAA